MLQLPKNTSLHWLHIFLVATLLTLNLIFFLFFKVSDYFTGFGFNEAVMYHLFYGIQGFDISLYLELFIGLFMVVILFAYLSYKLPQKYLVQKYFPISVIALLIALFFQPLTNNLFTLYGSSVLNRTFIGDLKPVINSDIKLNNKRNIVLIYAESFEKTYLDQDVFPNLTPNLTKLAQQGLSFNNLQQTYGATSTIAGMIATQCGVPFDSYGITDKSDPFLPSLYCLGDILSENDYILSYMGGASLKFAGKGNFYQSHQYQQVYGKENFLPLLNDKEYINNWGIYDDFLFKHVNKEYKRLNSSNTPFALVMLTLDTHHPDYKASRLCNAHTYGNGDNDVLNAIHCSDYQIGEFVKNIQKMDKKPLIIIASDHLSPNTGFFEQKLKAFKRSNMLIVLNSNLHPQEVNKIGTTLDTLPTVLNLLGSDIEEHNLGISLLSDKDSLIQSEPQLNKMLRSWTTQLRKFN